MFADASLVAPLGVAVSPTAPGTVPGVDEPRRRRPRFADVARRLRCPILGAIAALSLVSALSTAFAPALLGHPLVLVMLSPRLPFLAVAAAGVSAWSFIVVASLRLLVTDPLYFVLGRRHGAAAMAFVAGRLGRFGNLALRCVPLAVLLRPVGRHLVLAGAGRSRVWLIVAADVAGTLAYVLAIHAGTHAM
jgi:hypothetical protein